MHPIARARARAHAAERYQKSGAEDTLECLREFFEAVRARQAPFGVPPEHRKNLPDLTASVGDNAKDNTGRHAGFVKLLNDQRVRKFACLRTAGIRPQLTHFVPVVTRAPSSSATSTDTSSPHHARPTAHCAASEQARPCKPFSPGHVGSPPRTHACARGHPSDTSSQRVLAHAAFPSTTATSSGTGPAPAPPPMRVHRAANTVLSPWPTGTQRALADQSKNLPKFADAIAVEGWTWPREYAVRLRGPTARSLGRPPKIFTRFLWSNVSM